MLVSSNNFRFLANFVNFDTDISYYILTVGKFFARLDIIAQQITTCDLLENWCGRKQKRR